MGSNTKLSKKGKMAMSTGKALETSSKKRKASKAEQLAKRKRSEDIQVIDQGTEEDSDHMDDVNEADAVADYHEDSSSEEEDGDGYGDDDDNGDDDDDSLDEEYDDEGVGDDDDDLKVGEDEDDDDVDEKEDAGNEEESEENVEANGNSDSEDGIKSASKRKRAKKSSELKVEGLIIDDEMFLLNREEGIVYSTERSETGKLVKVGLWDTETKKMLPLPSEESSPDNEGGTHEESDDSREEENSDEDSDGDEEEEVKSDTVSGKRRGMASGVNYPFQVDDDDDHCETSPEAYEDVEPMLGQLAEKLGKTRAELKIYDPYYCTGQVVQNLGKLGFDNVYNKCEDFYEVQNAGEIPDHDVIVTNPPYSMDHMDRCIRFCCENGKPWLLLLPNYVYRKEYFEPALRAGKRPIMPFYLAPTQRYYYWSPKGLTRDNPRVRKDGRTSPFVSFWYCHMGRYTEDLCQWWNKICRGKEGAHGRRVVLARSPKQLPLGAMDEFDPNRKKRKVMLDRAQRAKGKAGRGGGGRGRGRGRGGRGGPRGKGGPGGERGSFQWSSGKGKASCD